ncbi:ornithine cyclodeaminase family protein [Kibdelosporangium lantanae]
MSLHYVAAPEVDRALARLDPVDLVRNVLILHAKEDVLLPDEAYLPWEAPDGTFSRSLAMPGLVRGDVNVAGTKIINANLGNPDRGLARAAGLVLLHDLTTARPRCLLNGTAISALRTAAVSVCAIEQLGSVGEVGVIGCGPLAEAHIRLLADRHDVRFRLYDRARARAEALSSYGRVVDSAEAAVRGADVVIPVTTTTTGYIPVAWLEPGSVVVNVSLDDVLPDVVREAGLVVVDDWGLVAADSRRLLGRMLRAGEIVGPHDPLVGAARRVDAELGEILVGAHPGRTSADQVVLVNPFGMAIADLALAAEVERTAVAEGWGQWLPFD